jgi:hypothetical protein
MIQANGVLSLMFGRSRLRFLPEDRLYCLRCHVLCLAIGRTTQHSIQARFGSGLKQITCASFCQPECDAGYGFDGPEFEFRKRQDALLQYIKTVARTHPESYSMGTGVLPEVRSLESEVTTQLYLVRKLRTSGAIPPLLCMP